MFECAGLSELDPPFAAYPFDPALYTQPAEVDLVLGWTHNQPPQHICYPQHSYSASQYFANAIPSGSSQSDGGREEV